jgi:hypothetical protein
MGKKDIRITEKKVDESWKSEAPQGEGETATPSTPRESNASERSQFITYLTSLGIETMICLGEIARPDTQERSVNIDAARQIIDLLILLQEKTRGNLLDEEKKLLTDLIAELQMKFVPISQAEKTNSNPS